MLLLAPWALPHVWRQSRALAVLMVAPLVTLLLFYSKYTQFEGGYSFGPRYLIPGLWLTGLTVGFVMKDGSPMLRRMAMTLVLAGAAVNVIGLATSPLEDMAGGRYYDERFGYRLDYNPIQGQLELLVKYPLGSDPGADRPWFRSLVRVPAQGRRIHHVARDRRRTRGGRMRGLRLAPEAKPGRRRRLVACRVVTI